MIRQAGDHRSSKVGAGCDDFVRDLVGLFPKQLVAMVDKAKVEAVFVGVLSQNQGALQGSHVPRMKV